MIFEHEFARELLKKLADLDLKSVKARPLISRYPSIRDYYAHNLADVFDSFGCNSYGISALAVFMKLSRYKEINSIAAEELQAIVNHWIPTVIPFLQASFSEMTGGALFSDDDISTRPWFLEKYLNEILKLKQDERSIAELDGVTIPLSAKDLSLIASYLPKIEAHLEACEAKIKIAAVKEALSSEGSGKGDAAKGGAGCIIS